ncbi:MAG: SDH family Clp fold serine proteinase [Verrucomicrobiia bacterium]
MENIGTSAKRRQAKIKRPPVLFHKTQVIISQIQKYLGSCFMSYWNSNNGSVCENDVVGIYGVLRKIGPQDKITLFIKSDGGSGQASLMMVNLLRQFTRRLVAVVPLECQSAATMLALGADEIQMGPLAHLSAVDTSLAHALSPLDRDNERVSVSQDELMRVIRLWQEEVGKDTVNPYQAVFPYIHPLVIGAVHRVSSLSVKLCMEILSYHLKDKKKAAAISQSLNSHYPSHTYPITLREAQRIGLKAKPLDPRLNDQLLELNQLYSEMGQRAVTDYDAFNNHDSQIYNIIEGQGVQIFYQSDRDWHYRKEERRWVTLNDKSAWRKIERVGSKTVSSVFHIS